MGRANSNRTSTLNMRGSLGGSIQVICVISRRGSVLRRRITTSDPEHSEMSPSETEHNGVLTILNSAAGPLSACSNFCSKNVWRAYYKYADALLTYALTVARYIGNCCKCPKMRLTVDLVLRTMNYGRFGREQVCRSRRVIEVAPKICTTT